MNTRSWLASLATSVATRRSARCSLASRETSTSLASGSPCRALALRGLAVGQVDPGGDERGRLAVVADHRAVRPGDQAPAAVLGAPVADLRARRPGPPDVGEEVPERLALLLRDHELARVATEHLFAPEPRRALARIVEQQDPGLAVVDADQRLGGLGQDRGEGFAENELRVVVHVSAWGDCTATSRVDFSDCTWSGRAGCLAKAMTLDGSTRKTAAWLAPPPNMPSTTSKCQKLPYLAS